MTSATPEFYRGPAFVTTRWTEVLSARGESDHAKAALGQLCDAYWTPVFRFIRRSSPSEDAARDSTQEFFSQLLTHRGFDNVDPGRGRFRSYLLGAVKHFLADQRERANAAKRGGGMERIPIESPEDTQTSDSLQIADPSALVSDAYFDRQWAMNLIDRVLKTLATELAAAGKERHYEVLKPWLVGEVDHLSQAQAAEQLGFSEGAIKVAVHRMRKRFREIVKAEIADTVEQPSTVQDELRYLLEVLTQN